MQPSIPAPKTFVITLRCGRLANRLIMFANFAAYAQEHGHQVINFTFHSYAHLFEQIADDIYCRYPAARRKSWMDTVPGVAPLLRKTRLPYHLSRLATVMNERLPFSRQKIVTLRGIDGRPLIPLDDPIIQERIRPANLIFVYEWGLRAPELVVKHAAAIRRFFRPAAAVETASQQAIDPLRRNADVVVGVHIRQGDYRRWHNGKYFFPASRYAEWMREMAGQFPGRRVAFLVCSDEPRDVSEFPGLTVGFGANSPAGDLYALAKCDYIIGSVSTFSQWASYYGAKPMLHLRNDIVIRLENFKISDLDLIL